MKYLHNFETTSEFEEQYNGEGYLEPWVSLTLELLGLQETREFHLVGQ